jgi:hypothetical protein
MSMTFEGIIQEPGGLLGFSTLGYFFTAPGARQTSAEL